MEHYFIPVFSLMLLIIVILISAMVARKRAHKFLVSIHHQNKIIIMKQQELADQLTALGTQLAKVKSEILGAVSNLESQIQNAGNVTPDVETAFNALKTAVQGLDDLNADVAPQG